jgi:hypothetical protein
MKYTNKLNLPEPIALAVRRHPYTKGPAEFSVTELIKPPQIRALSRAHDEELEVDVADQLYQLCGSIGHAILERAGPDAGLLERRFFYRIKDGRGREATVSGQADLILKPNTIEADLKDYKFCSIWVAKNGKPKPEWIEQLNAYQFLAENGQYMTDAKGSDGERLFVRSNLRIKTAEIVAIFRDWSKRKVGSEPGYPIAQAARIPIALWTQQEQLKWLTDRVTLHLDAFEEYQKGGALPECTPEEQWAKPSKFAVMKDGNKKATKAFDDRSKANAFIAALSPDGKGYWVDHRPGEKPRCEDYCEVAQFCEQRKKELAEKASGVKPAK